MLGPTTPAEKSESVLTFCAKIDSTEKPIFLLLHPERKAIPNECFSNVREHVSTQGGSMQLGWLIWETPGIMLEATLHAVWRSPDGTLVDVTPQVDGESEILFLPDPKAKIDPNKPDGEVVGMRRFPLVDDPLLYEFILLGERKDAVKVRTQGKLTRSDLIEMAEIQRQQIPLQEKLALKYRGKLGGLKVQPLSYTGPLAARLYRTSQRRYATLWLGLAATIRVPVEAVRSTRNATESKTAVWTYPMKPTWGGNWHPHERR